MNGFACAPDAGDYSGYGAFSVAYPVPIGAVGTVYLATFLVALMMILLSSYDFQMAP